MEKCSMRSLMSGDKLLVIAGVLYQCASSWSVQAGICMELPAVPLFWHLFLAVGVYRHTATKEPPNVFLLPCLPVSLQKLHAG